MEKILNATPLEGSPKIDCMFNFLPYLRYKTARYYSRKGHSKKMLRRIHGTLQSSYSGNGSPRRRGPGVNGVCPIRNLVDSKELHIYGLHD